MQLAAKIQHLEFSCSEKVRERSGETPPVCSAHLQPAFAPVRGELGAPLLLAKSSLSLPPSQPGWASLLLSLPLSTGSPVTVAAAFPH